jgi:hypothetical protein
MVCAYVEHYTKHLDAFRILYIWPQVLGIHGRLATAQSPWSAPAVAKVRQRIQSDADSGALRVPIDPEQLVANAWAFAHGLVSIASARGLVAAKPRFSLPHACRELSSYLLSFTRSQ